MRTKSQQVIAAAAVLVSACVVRADEPWTLTTSDFKTEPATLSAADEKTLTLIAGDGTPRTVPADAFVQLVGPAKAKSPEGLVLCVADGQRLIGTPVKIDGANLIWFANGVGEVAVPLESLLAVLRNRSSIDGLSDARTEDVARLNTGDTVRGIMTEAGKDGFVLTPANGNAVTVALNASTSLLFASPPEGRKTLPPAYLVRLTSGSVVAAEVIAFAAGKLTLTSAGKALASLPLSQVVSIEHTGGPVAWLSTREPTKVESTPYFDANFPPRMDASVTGGPIRFGGQTFTRGIGVHSRSRLSFALQPGDTTFRTRYAIDGNQPLADVDVTILLDDQPVHTNKGFKSGTLSPLIEIPLGQAKTLTLVVDYGKNLDVQDRLNWIEPAIVRQVVRN